MKRFLRWAFNGLAAMSLLLCMATLALWAASFRTHAPIPLGARYEIDYSRSRIGVSNEPERQAYRRRWEPAFDDYDAWVPPRC